MFRTRRRSPLVAMLLACLISSSIALAPAATATASAGNPLLGARWFINHQYGLANVQERAYCAAHQWRLAALMHKIAAEPQTERHGSWSPDVGTEARQYLRYVDQTEPRTVPVFATYDLNHGPCGGHADSPSGRAAYRGWINSFARAVGGHPAVVYLEQDALITIGCLSRAGLQIRLSELAYASSVLGSLLRTSHLHGRRRPPTAIPRRPGWPHCSDAPGSLTSAASSSTRPTSIGRARSSASVTGSPGSSGTTSSSPRRSTAAARPCPGIACTMATRCSAIPRVPRSGRSRPRTRATRWPTHSHGWTIPAVPAAPAIPVIPGRASGTRATPSACRARGLVRLSRPAEAGHPGGRGSASAAPAAAARPGYSGSSGGFRGPALRSDPPGLGAAGVVVARLSAPDGFERADRTLDSGTATLVRGVVTSTAGVQRRCC